MSELSVKFRAENNHQEHQNAGLFSHHRGTGMRLDPKSNQLYKTQSRSGVWFSGLPDPTTLAKLEDFFERQPLTSLMDFPNLN